MRYELQFAKTVGIPLKEDSKFNVLYNNSIGPVVTETSSKEKELEIQKFNKTSDNPSC